MKGNRKKLEHGESLTEHKVCLVFGGVFVLFLKYHYYFETTRVITLEQGPTEVEEIPPLAMFRT